MAIATLAQLEEELLTEIVKVAAFADSGFSIFDIDDMDDKKAGQTLPCVGVAWDGRTPEGNEAKPTGRTHAATLATVQFIVVVAVEYRYTGSDDTKQQAFALLDQLVAALSGFKGVNSRPWRFAGDAPEVAASGDGVIFYSQAWQTSLPIVGNFNSN